MSVKTTPIADQPTLAAGRATHLRLGPLASVRAPVGAFEHAVAGDQVLLEGAFKDVAVAVLDAALPKRGRNAARKNRGHREVGAR